MTINDDSKLAAEALRSLEAKPSAPAERYLAYCLRLEAEGRGFEKDGRYDMRDLAKHLETGAKVILPKEALAVIEAARYYSRIGGSHTHGNEVYGGPLRCEFCTVIAAYDKAVA